MGTHALTKVRDASLSNADLEGLQRLRNALAAQRPKDEEEDHHSQGLALSKAPNFAKWGP